MKIFVTYVTIDKVFGIVTHESPEFTDKFFAIEKDEKVHGIPFERLRDNGVGEYGSAVIFAQCHQEGNCGLQSISVSI
jgi:lysine/ornithine N-monooxygenase